MAARDEISYFSASESELDRVSLIGRGLRKRAIPYPKAISLPSAEKLCPKTGSGPATECSKILAADEVYSAQSQDYGYIRPNKRDLDDLIVDAFNSSSSHVVERRDGVIERRAKGKDVTICRGTKKHEVYIKAWNEDGNFDIWDNENWGECNNCKFEAHALSPMSTHLHASALFQMKWVSSPTDRMFLGREAEINPTQWSMCSRVSF